MLTCIDCLKDFYGDEYKSHNACMSEEQRYSKDGRAGWDPEKGQGKKGEKRQNIWTTNLRAILAETQNIEPDVRNIVNTILDHENIPRKKPKSVNFVKNIMRNRANVHSIDKTWDLFSQALKPTAEEASKSKEDVESDDVPETIVDKKKKSKKEKKKDKEKENGDVEMADDDGTKKKSKKDRKKEKLKAMEEEIACEDTSEKENTDKNTKKKKKKLDKVEEDEVASTDNKLKRKIDESMEVDEDASSPPKKVKFDWDDTITKLLMNKDGNEMKLKKLKKKCVSEFFSQNEDTHKTAEEVGSKFDKKLKKRKFRLLKDKVKLILEEEKEPEVVPEKCANDTPAPPQESKGDISFNQWEATNLGSSAQTEKFRRLMGIKTAAPPQAVQAKFGGAKRDDQKIFRDLEQGFERARQAHFGGRCFEQ